MEKTENSDVKTSNHSLFKRVKIGARVGLGFFIILMMFIITSVFNLKFFNEIKQSFSDYSSGSNKAIAVISVDRQVSEMQRAILAYSNTGNNGIIKKAMESHNALLDNLATIRNTVIDQRKLNLLNSMIKNLKNYGENFDALVESREQRNHLVDISMVAVSNEIFSVVAQLTQFSAFKNDNDLSKKIYIIHKLFLEAQVDAMSFLNYRKYVLQKRAKLSLTRAKNSARQLSQSNLSSEQRGLSKILVNNINEYEEKFYQAVQATRAYLFLVNVVMAGEAAEFSTLSKTLKKSKLLELYELSEYTELKVKEAQNTILYVIVAALIIGTILVFLISQSISLPITQITETFNQLTNQKHDTAIPGLDREDEVGQLAKAANVFKSMNEKNKAILAELKLRESQLYKQTLELQKSNDDLDNFAYIASHDLKSPLNAIDNLAKWIIEDCSDVLPDASRTHLSKLQQRVNRMQNLLSDLLHYSRVGRVDVDINTINVAELVQDTIGMINKPENFLVSVGQTLPVIDTQVLPLQQVFLNLFTNAVKYNDKEKCHITVSSLQLNDEYIEFSVKDNGPGIDSKFHKRIFQMFQTLQSRDVIESSGMGLAIIKKVIERLGGEIRVDSKPGEGSTFAFSWPIDINGKGGPDNE